MIPNHSGLLSWSVNILTVKSECWCNSSVQNLCLLVCYRRTLPFLHHVIWLTPHFLSVMLMLPNSFFQHVSQGHCSCFAPIIPVGRAHPVSGPIRSYWVADIKMAVRVLKPQPSFQPWLETGLHIVQGRLGMALFQWITDPRFSFVRLRSRFAPLVIMFTEGLN